MPRHYHCISGDGHIDLNPDIWRARVQAKYSERAPKRVKMPNGSDAVVIDGVRLGDRIFMEETFGPIVGIASYQSLNEAIEMANAPGYGLSSSIYTTDPKDAFTFRDKISAGMVSINNSTSGAEAHLPFGGNGK